MVDVGGVPVATYVLEPRGGAHRGDVVLCHGTPWSSQVWSRAAHELSREHRVLLWDMPGYGRSRVAPDVALDLRSQSQRLGALLEHWGASERHVVAHDVGGAVALGAHLLDGVDLGALFLWDAVVLDPWGSAFFRLVAEHEQVFAVLPAALHAALVREYVSGAAAGALHAAWLEALVEPWLGEPAQAAFYRQVAQLAAADTGQLVAGLGEVRCPVRIGWGAEDPWLPAEQAHRLRELLPGESPVVVVPGTGHLVPVERPGAVLEALRAWLTAPGGV
ncbi:alpha/beta hydrolase [Nocardioides nanhaiensis]|uniref:Alpha/beta hydrolase n=1 Tax=Nocardioides nanhaiensis TaxID=1476871 RepID=A0ABP8WNB1_9ACTN